MWLHDYVSVFTQSPILTLVLTVMAFTWAFHLIAPLLSVVKQQVVGFWTRYEENVKNWYLSIFLPKVCRVIPLIGLSDLKLEVVKVGNVTTYDWSTEIKFGDIPEHLLKEMYVLRKVGSDRYYNKSLTDWSSYIYNKHLFSTKEAAEACKNVPDFLTITLNLLLYTLVFSIIGMLLDALLFNHLFETLVFLILSAVVAAVLFGGRAMYDIQKKLDSNSKPSE